MPRPKGSKNKPKTAKSETFEEQIEALKKECERLHVIKDEQESILAEAKEKLKVTKRDIRKIETKIKNLEVKKAENEATVANAKKKKAIEEKIYELINSGKATDDIIEALNQL